MTIEDVSFFSGPGLRLAAQLYLPDPANDRGAGVVFCLGFGGVKEGTPVGLSTRLAAHGYTVLSFDYRGFGGSEGVRGRLVPNEQVEDATHALEFLAARAGVEPHRIGLYGTSFGGGIALLAARRSDRARALVVTVPVVSGGDWLRSLCRGYEFQELEQRSRNAIAQKTLSGEIEMVDRFEIMIPDPVTRQIYQEPFPMALETFVHVLGHEPIAAAERIEIPVGVIGVTNDQLVPPSQSTQLFERLPGPKMLAMLDGDDHFAVYDPLLDQVAMRTIAWFDEHLAPATPSGATGFPT